MNKAAAVQSLLLSVIKMPEVHSWEGIASSVNGAWKTGSPHMKTEIGHIFSYTQKLIQNGLSTKSY